HPPARDPGAGAPQRRPGGRAAGRGHGAGGHGRSPEAPGRSGRGLHPQRAGRLRRMALTEAPRIVTARLGYDDSYTLERYLATGGYEGLRKALTMTPEAELHEVDTGSLLGPRGLPGRGGAGFPAGRKWALLGKKPVTSLAINGDEDEPATFKGHLLIDRN